MCSIYFLVWALCWFMLTYGMACGCLAKQGDSEDPKNEGPRRFRVTCGNRNRKAALYGLISLFSFLFLGFTKGVECPRAVLNKVFPNDLDGSEVAFALLLLGAFVPVLFDSIREIKARRNVCRFLTDCREAGSLRAIHESASEGRGEWVAHDMRQDGHNLSRLAKRIVQGYYYKPVLIAMNIPPEKVLQKLAQYKLITKDGCERLPPPETYNYFPKGGAMVHFYYQAEYVRIWG